MIVEKTMILELGECHPRLLDCSNLTPTAAMCQVEWSGLCLACGTNQPCSLGKMTMRLGTWFVCGSLNGIPTTSTYFKKLFGGPKYILGMICRVLCYSCNLFYL